ncbi:hypothetical protein BGZ65_006297 [Modicella reniformis]|uniref:G-patch domain-containing protein n=1 Tax=Modicella reniformis TaxID=1440133 RepID=A0A9P6MLD4_9FUNG|nr:hypothetical protein BGZ65_006297 [Modicella reniformis]
MSRDIGICQSVRDEQGRRRFHGAFTGGFSAGYYNTVGSKEGWAPSEFVSSRDKRSEKIAFKPEDFMDEEDKQMLADSARLTATSDFDTTGSTRRDLEMKRAAARTMQASGSVLGALPDTLIDDIIVPSSEPVGIRLLKRMGWKPGQGIGPRVSRRQQKPGDAQHSDEDDEQLVNVTFAPIDSAVVIFTNKTNHQGLGFDPYKNAPEFDRSLRGQADSKYLTADPKSRKAELGFGTFDDDDDEDDEVYGSGPKTLRSLDYDMALNDHPRSRRDEGKGKPEKSDTLVVMYCTDGRPPLPGFALAATPAKPLKWYSALKVPKDFVPHHTFDDDVKPIIPTNKREQPKLTVDERALVLGETPIDGPRRSVFEYISADNKNRLDNILGFVMDTEGEKRLRKDHWEVPKIEKQAAEAALKGFIPFGDNIAKQNRYKQYLNVQAGISDEKIELVEGFSGQEMTNELNEFVQAARIFKPLTSTMANRFTTASKVFEFAQPAAGLRSAEDIKALEKTAPTHHAVEKMEVPKSQATKAAAMGMFGPLTRTVMDLYPSKLDSIKPGEGMMDEDITLGNNHDNSSLSVKEISGDVVIEEEQSDQSGEVQERPPMDIFKAIFDNSDTESESGSNSEDDQKDPVANKTDKMEVIEGEGETSQEPFKPVFTRRSDRVGVSSSIPPSRIQSRSRRLDIPHSDDDEGGDSEIGPKLTIPNAATTKAAKRLADNKVDDTNNARKTSLIPERNRSSGPDDFIGPPPPAPEKRSQGESGSEVESREERNLTHPLRDTNHPPRLPDQSHPHPDLNGKTSTPVAHILGIVHLQKPSGDSEDLPDADTLTQAWMVENGTSQADTRPRPESASSRFQITEQKQKS